MEIRLPQNDFKVTCYACQCHGVLHLFLRIVVYVIVDVREHLDEEVVNQARTYILLYYMYL